MKTDIRFVRNIGISAHIDSGKTTLTERILYYTNRIHRIQEVRGKDGGGAFMDSMELEKERGITIASAATYCLWNNHEINIIDTPGHVDFTIEVERALRVLDGAILVLCAVGGVQSQSITVDLQMKRYNVPCIAFINKCDRTGADPQRVVSQMKEKLGHNAVLMQLPIGLGHDFEGIIDLVSMQAIYFDGENGETVRYEPIAPQFMDEAEAYREILMDAASDFSDELMEAVIEDRKIDPNMVYDALRIGTRMRKITPVFLGSAYKNKGVQPLLDAVCRLLPSPADIDVCAFDLNKNDAEITLRPEAGLPPVALAFKLEDGPYGQLTYIRLYQGSLNRGDTIENTRTGKRVKIGRIVRMHADKMEDVPFLPPGYIGAFFGIDCASGDTFSTLGNRISLSSMYIPEPVISMAIKPEGNESQKKLSRALNRFSKEDPTFRTHFDPETEETIISGMGELHLEIYLERMRREYGITLSAGAPQVSYRETITRKSTFDYTHKKQTGGAGQFGRVAGYIEPIGDEEFEFENRVTGGAIPTQYIAACEKGFRESMARSPWLKYPIRGIRIVLLDGASHSVDSSDMAFAAAARGAFRQAYLKALPVLLEPVMKVEVETPSEYQGNVMGTLNQRRGVILGVNDEGNRTIIEAQVPLSEMFGYATVLRSQTRGQAQFTMEFSSYKEVPASIAEKIADEVKKADKTGT